MGMSDPGGDGGPLPSHYSAKRVRRGLKDFLLGKGFALLASLVTAVLLVRAMPVQDYAIYATLIGLQLILIASANLGLDRAITRYFPQARQANDASTLVGLVRKFFRWRMTGIVVVLGLASAATPWLAEVFHAEGHETGFYLMWLYTALFGLSKISTRMLQSLMKQRAVKWAIFTESGLRLALLAAWLIHTGALTVEQALVVFCMAASAGVVMLEYALWSEVNALKCAPDVARISIEHDEVLHFSRQNYFQELLLLPGQPSSLRLIGAYFLAPAAMAAFGFFQGFTGNFRRNLPVQVLLDFTEPVIMAAYFRDKSFERLNRMAGSVLKVNLFLLAPLLTWLVIEAGSVTALLTGGKYVEQAWMLPVMVVGLMYESHWIVLRTVVNAVDRPDILVKAGMSSTVVLLLIVAAMLASSQVQAGALVLGSVAILAWRNGHVVWRVRKAKHDYRLDWLGFGKLLLAAALAAVCGMAVVWITNAGVLSWMATGAVMLITYPLLARVLRPFGEDERALLLKVHRKFGLLF